MAQATANFDQFYQDLKETEKQDSVLTSEQQIGRLLRPGHTYRNLNPFEVLQVQPEAGLDDIKKKYRRLSILVHPDKNQGDLERAQAAFDAVKKAYELLESDETRKKCLEIVEEARGRTRLNVEEKRKKLKKEAQAKGQPADNILVEEDDPDRFEHSVKVLTMKLFADLELKRRQNEDRLSEEAARKRQQELDAAEKRKVEMEYAKQWEETRQGRVDSWINFKSGRKTTDPAPSSSLSSSSATELPPPPRNPQQMVPADKDKKSKKKKDKRFSPMGFKPPKHKPESR